MGKKNLGCADQIIRAIGQLPGSHAVVAWAFEWLVRFYKLNSGNG
jgi:hypothetical protein